MTWATFRTSGMTVGPVSSRSPWTAVPVISGCLLVRSGPTGLPKCRPMPVEDVAVAGFDTMMAAPRHGQAIYR